LQEARDAAVQTSGSVQGARAIIALQHRLGCTPTDERSQH
jgi:hypothetical protein